MAFAMKGEGGNEQPKQQWTGCRKMMQNNIQVVMVKGHNEILFCAFIGLT